jgi:hypothetical protein
MNEPQRAQIEKQFGFEERQERRIIFWSGMTTGHLEAYDQFAK